MIKLLLAFLILANSSLSAQNETFSPQQEEYITTFIKSISGLYNNQAQADTTSNPLLRLTEIRIFPIWVNKKNDYWFSIGWYQPNFPDQPLGEKIFHIQSISHDTLLVDCYSWENPYDEKLLLQWMEKKPYAKQKFSDLVNNGCKNYLVKDANGRFNLKTFENQICSFKDPLAPFDGIFFDFIFEEGTMDIYDKNFKEKKVLFEYTQSPILMKKVEQIH